MDFELVDDDSPESVRERFLERSAGRPMLPLVRLWILRGLATLDEERLCYLGGLASKCDVFASVGLKRWSDYQRGVSGDDQPMTPRLGQMLAECEAQQPSPPDVLRDNVEHLVALLGLSDAEAKVLAFAVSIHCDGSLAQGMRILGTDVDVRRAMAIMSAVLRLPEDVVNQSLSEQGPLGRTGLVRLDRISLRVDLAGRLDLFSPNFAPDMHRPGMSPTHLLRGIVAKAGPAELSLADYCHLDAQITVLRAYLQHSLANKRTGVNILIHGVPGTGKSQLTRVLAATLESELFEVATEDPEGAAITGKFRLNALAAAQCFFASRRALLVFDEIEDVFNDGMGWEGGRSTAQVRKGWLNHMLETNRLPTFWLSNAIDQLDRAFIRRFDMVFALNIPPKKQREYIIASLCHDVLGAEAISRLAESEHLAPAVVARASSVVSSIRGTLGEDAAASTLELLVNQTLQAQGHAVVRQASTRDSRKPYDPACVNTDTNLADLVRGLQRTREGRLCLYGPPGTGKTAWGRWLADELGVPLHVKRASDLLGMFVGQSEKQVAEAFRQARENGAMLMLDEVDSFLQDRRGAQRSWETTLVNEMLTQMETFSGVFVASTNLMDNLDAAALRRFDLKLRFDYLQPAQSWLLLQRYVKELGLRRRGDDLKTRLARLDCLTPGDFALVARQHTFRPLSSAQAFVDALAAECLLKSPVKRAIGFT